MSGLLFGVGAVAFVAGVVMVGFGIPINEFSFGNTLISAGTTAAVGGLIVIGLSMVLAKLHHISEALSAWTPIRPGQPFGAFDAVSSRGAPAAGRIPFPPKPKPSAPLHEPRPLESKMEAPATDAMPAEERHEQSFAPTLRNPEEPPVTVEDEVSLSPQQPMAAPAPATAERGEPAPAPSAPPLFGWRPSRPAAPEPVRQPHAAYFDAMWPAEPKPAKIPPAAEAKPIEPKLDLPPDETAAEPTKPEAPSAPENEPRTVAILKSGVVDGMGYTLYVDGSIEAELPQGTLRFASINELRSHLEANS